MPHRHLTELLRRLPELGAAEQSIVQAYEILRDSFQAGGKVGESHSLRRLESGDTRIESSVD
jgi:hypothetical protein